MSMCFFFFFKQKTAYEMRISDWSSDVCSSDLKSRVTILDPAFGKRTMRYAEVSEHFTGVALELTPTAEFKPAKAVPSVSARQLTGPVTGLWRSEERRVGKECVSTCRSRWSPYH